MAESVQRGQPDAGGEDLPSGTHTVCPRCGTASGESRWCASCGLNLSKQGELPTADAYGAKIREERWLAGQEALRREEQRSGSAHAAGTQAAAARPTAAHTRQPDPRADAKPKSDQPHSAHAARERRPYLVAYVLLALVAAGVGAALAITSGSGGSSGPHPVPVVRTMMVAAESGDGATACAQLTHGLATKISEDTGLSCAEAATQYASPQRRADAAAATLTPTVNGNQASVRISSPSLIGEPFQDSDSVHLTLVNGTWKVSCLGYCPPGSIRR